MRGIIRLLSAIRSEWVAGYIEKTKKVDIFRLAEIELDNKNDSTNHMSKR